MKSRFGDHCVSSATELLKLKVRLSPCRRAPCTLRVKDRHVVE